MTATKVGVALSLSQHDRLRAVLSLEGIESVDGIQALSGYLAPLDVDTLDAETETITIPSDFAPAMRRMVSMALKHEFDYIEGLCSRGMVDTALARLDSEHGPHILIDLFKSVTVGQVPVVSPDQGVQSVMNHW
jgi:hypothetical protein